MAKLFYTLEEAASKLSMTPEAVRELVSSGQLQEFRDRDRLMFKRDQVDLLAHKEEDGGIPLAESGELGAISLASDSGSAMNMENPKEQTGVSISDADATEEADPSAVTHVTETSQSELALETVGAGSGSGLLDLTREADDTSLGKNLLEDAETTADSAVDAGASGAESGALFESTGAEAETAAAAPAMLAMIAEPYDGPWSGLTGGVALGLLVLLTATLSLVIFGLQSTTGVPLVRMIGENFWPFVGGGAALVLVCAIIGFVIGRKG